MISILARFFLVGIANSIIGFAIIAILDVGFHVNPAMANAIAYVVGISVSFFLTRKFVFRVHADATSQYWRYVVAMAFAFSINQLVLFATGMVLGAGSLRHLAAQLAGMAAYTVTNFLLCSRWVFSHEAELPYRDSR